MILVKNNERMMYKETDFEKRQCKFVDLLCHLTQLGKATWLRSNIDITWIYCFIGSERIIIDFSDSQETLNLDEIYLDTPFVACYRGYTFLYLGGQLNGDKLLLLIKNLNIPIDDVQIRKHERNWRNHLLDELESFDLNS